MNRRTVLSYCAAGLAALIALAIRLPLTPWIGDQFPFSLFVFAVLVVAWQYGLRPAAVTAILGGILSFFFILSPGNPRGEFIDLDDAIGLVIYTLVTSGVAMLGDQMQRVRREAKNSEESVRRKNEELFERIRAQEALYASEERLRKFIELAPVPIAMLDREMKYIVVSRRWAQDFHLDYNNLIGRSHYEVFPHAPVAWKEDHKRALAGYSQSCECGRLILVDGTEQWIRREMRPWHDSNGAVGGILIFAEDITAQKKTEAVLRRSEKQTRLLLDSTAEAIYGVDMQGNFTFCNTAFLRILGYKSADQLLGKNVHNLIHHSHEDGRPYPKCECKVYAAFIKGEEAHSSDDVMWRADGTPLHVEYWSYPIRDEGKIMGCVVTFVDISERLNLAAQLGQAQKMECVGQLAGGVAHDFNNLLTVINGRCQLLLDREHPDEKIRKGLELVYRTGERAAALTRQLLDFSRKTILEPKILNLNAVATDLEKMLRRLIREDITLKLQLDPELWRVKADPGKIEQVLMNLVVNARDAMPNGGVLSIETGNCELSAEYCRTHAGVSPGKYVRLAISDNGTGMTAETRKRIFEPFFTTKERGKGTGLGLTTVYGIVKQSSGFIEVYSEPGHGTTFKIYLPRETGTERVFDSSAVLASVGNNHETILLVEDEAAVRDLTADLLEVSGFKVITAENGREAFKSFVARADTIDLVVTDVVMPEMGGPELVRRLRTFFPNLRVLYTSGYADHAVVNNGEIEEGEHFLQKPFSPSSLAQKVREALERKPGNVSYTKVAVNG